MNRLYRALGLGYSQGPGLSFSGISTAIKVFAGFHMANTLLSKVFFVPAYDGSQGFFL